MYVTDYGKTYKFFSRFAQVDSERLDPAIWTNQGLIKFRQEWIERRKSTTKVKGTIRDMVYNPVDDKIVFLVQVGRDFVAINEGGLL